MGKSERPSYLSAKMSTDNTEVQIIVTIILTVAALFAVSGSPAPRQFPTRVVAATIIIGP
jgi:hypothetical protein